MNKTTMNKREHEILKNQVTLLYDNYRTALYNVYYYGKRLKRTRHANLAFEITMAVTLPGAAGVWILTNLGVIYTESIIAFVSLLAIIKPFTRISDNLQRYARLHTTYNEIASELERLVEKVRIEQQYSLETEIKSDIQVKRMRSLFVLDDEDLDPEQEKECQKKVNKQIPSDSLWVPSMEVK